MLNFVIYTCVFSITLGACLFWLDYRFEPFKPKCMDKRMTYKALMVNEASKRGQITQHNEIVLRTTGQGKP